LLAGHGLGCISISLLISCSPPPAASSAYIQWQGKAFGTSYSVLIGTTDFERQQKDRPFIKNLIETEIRRLDLIFSNWNQASEISSVNNSRPLTPVAVSADFLTVWQQSFSLYQSSQGAFDPASAAIFDAWGFGQHSSHQAIHQLSQDMLPDASVLKRLQKLSGMRQYIVQPNLILRKNDRVILNFSANAKGFLVDQIFQVLARHGYQHTMVEVGGEVRTGLYPRSAAERNTMPNGKKSAEVDHAPNRDATTMARHKNSDRFWKIGIEEPVYQPERRLNFIALLENQAMATSGDYRNYFVIKENPQGRRYSHIIDPRTAEPRSNGVLSVSVIGPDCLQADALATTLMLFEPREGIEFLQRYPEFKALIQYRRSDPQGLPYGPLLFASSPGILQWLQSTKDIP
ncbi:MAG: FAD:protein FMN transferase, partial [Leptospiraceae bacterium]|nr:FAD:protein FMN transferase [Leptospiraceae bacterium]